MVPKLEHHPKTKKLQKNTHTKYGVFPPIVVSVSINRMFKFNQRKEWS